MTHENIARWWVVQTKPQAEFTALDQLQRQGFNGYCPLFHKEIIRGRQVKVVTSPLFPRYLFIEATPTAQAQVHVIRSTVGVTQFLKVGEDPVIVPANVMEDIRQLEDEHQVYIHAHFKTGDKVTVRSGIYQNLEAVFHENHGLTRAVVLLNLLQSDTKLMLDKTQLKKIHHHLRYN